MDLLVVLSTTTAYFASLAMLVVDVRSPRMMMDEEKCVCGACSVELASVVLTLFTPEPRPRTMTLFDASVFLIFFIVLGRSLEGWAKSKVSLVSLALAK